MSEVKAERHCMLVDAMLGMICEVEFGFDVIPDDVDRTRGGMREEDGTRGAEYGPWAV